METWSVITFNRPFRFVTARKTAPNVHRQMRRPDGLSEPDRTAGPDTNRIRRDRINSKA